MHSYESEQAESVQYYDVSSGLNCFDYVLLNYL